MKQNKQFLFGMVLGAMALSVFGVGVATATPVSFTPTTKKNADNSLSVSYGKPYFTDTATTTQTYKLSDFTISGSSEGIASVSITVSSGSVSTTADTAYTTYSDFIKTTGAQHKTVILGFKALQTSDAVTQFVRNNITFDSSANSSADVTQQIIRVSLNLGAAALESTIPADDAVSTLIDSDGNTHFYIFDNKAGNSATTLVSWDTAYNYAKSLKLFGMKGYLATITSDTEDAVVDALTTEGGWAGAICDTITTKDADTAAGLGQSGTTAARKVKTNWQWVCGPEAGTALFKTDGTVADGQYDGWKSTGEPNGYSSGSEWCLDLHFGGHWNDYPSSNTAGAFVEFSPYPTSNAISFKETLPTGNWKAWTPGTSSNFATYGTATRTTNQGSGSETWSTIPYLPQPSKESLNVAGTFWTETAYTAPSETSEGSVTYTASGNHSETLNAQETAYSFTVPKTLMKLVQAGSESTTLLTGLTAGSQYKITMTDGTSVTITADSTGQFNLGTYDSGSQLGKTLSTMVMVDSSGTTISETQTLPSTVVRRKYDVPVPSVTYGDNDTVAVSGLTAGHTYTIAGKTYVADTNNTVTLTDVLGSSASSLAIIDTSVDDTHYISSEAGSVNLIARPAAPAAGGYRVTPTTSASKKAQVNVPSGSEYYDEANQTWVKGQATALVTPSKSLTVRLSATGAAPASETTSIPTDPFKQPTPAATIDYKAGMFHNLTANTTYTIDKKDYITDANGDLEIDIPLYGHTFTLITKHVNSDGSDIDSDTQTLTAIAMPDAPAAANYPVTEATSADGKASVVIPDGSEYLDPTTKKWIKGATTALVTPGTSIEVRTSGTSSTPFSHNTTITTKSYQWPTPAAAIDYSDKKLTGFTAGATYTINGKSFTADADGKIAIDPSWFGTSLSVIKSHVNSDGSDVDSDAQTISVAAIPAAPALTDYAVSEATTSDGKATVSVPAGSEYLDPTTGAWIKGPTSVSVTPGTSVKVRVSATATSPASEEASVATHPYQQATPSAAVDYSGEKLTGFEAGATYTINGKSFTADASGNIPMDESWYGSSLSIIKTHVNSDGSDIDSVAETIAVSARPSVPSDTDVSKKDNDDGSETITVTDTQEYSLDGGKTWIKGTNNSVNVDGQSSVMVRTAATSTTPASEPTTISGDSSRAYRTTPAIVAYCLGFLILLLLAYRVVIYVRWHNKDKHNHMGFFVANNRWVNQIFFHTPYNKVELQAQEAAKQAAQNKGEGK